MNEHRRRNLRRLLSPTHVAFVGGDSAAAAVDVCRNAGFTGQMWGVNPARSELAGVPCFPSIDALPAPPDAVFLAVPTSAAVQTVSEAAAFGSGGIVCFTAGFSELGATGATVEDALVAAAGDCVLVGPNCSGLINFVDGASLWPFEHGGTQVRRGPVFVTQSGMLGNTVTLNQRGLRFSYVVSSGNQAMLTIEDYIEYFTEIPSVNAIGLYVEGLDDIQRFAQVAQAALTKRIPIVVMKVGRSETAANIAMTHTGSIAGPDALYDALFKRLGIIRVSSAVEMIETLKMLTQTRAPTGHRVVGLTCSGGDCAMLADGAERVGLELPRLSEQTSQAVTAKLPGIATVANPLDYTTPLWGDEAALTELFRDVLIDEFDAAVLIQDYLPDAAASGNEPYFADARAFAKATRDAGIAAVACSILPENLPEPVCDILKNLGIAPLQGVDSALKAIRSAAQFDLTRRKRLDDTPWALSPAAALTPTDAHEDATPEAKPEAKTSAVLNEAQSKSLLRDGGIVIPQGTTCAIENVPRAAKTIGFPIVVKYSSSKLLHKSDANAVRINIETADEASSAAKQVLGELEDSVRSSETEDFLVEEMIPHVIAELIVGVRWDKQFGYYLVLGSGGTTVELNSDAQTLLLPANREDVVSTLSQLMCFPKIDGYRNAPKASVDAIVDVALKAVELARIHRLRELEINPLLAREHDAIAADALIIR